MFVCADTHECFCVCVSIYVICVGMLMEPIGHVGSSGAGVAGSCMPSDSHAGNWTQVLWKSSFCSCQLSPLSSTLLFYPYAYQWKSTKTHFWGLISESKLLQNRGKTWLWWFVKDTCRKKIELKDPPESKGKESEDKLKYNIYNKSMKHLKPLRIFVMLLREQMQENYRFKKY